MQEKRPKIKQTQPEGAAQPATYSFFHELFNVRALAGGRCLKRLPIPQMRLSVDFQRLVKF
jgi:hypothetical protein